MADSSSNAAERRLWIGNLDTRITEYQLLKIVQKCGDIEKFDVLFHKTGPLAGQPRGYAFVTYSNVDGAQKALTALDGKLIGSKSVYVRLAKNIDYDEIIKVKPKIDIPALAAGSSSTTGSKFSKLSKEVTIQAIEAKLKMLENKSDDFVVNKTTANERPLIQKYQFNKNVDGNRTGPAGSGKSGNSNSRSSSSKYNSKSRHKSGPYNKRFKR